MSVLDMFASALGAFIMVAIIIFPYYQKNRPIKEKLDAVIVELNEIKDEVDKANSAAAKVEQENDDIRAEIRRVQLSQVELNQCKQGVAACLVEMGTTFLLVKIEWQDSADIDLHVTDAQGNRFSFDKTNKNGTAFPNSQARLSIDTVVGPGIEVWQVPIASVGDYKIEYVLNGELGREISVKGFLFDKYGKKTIPEKILGKDVRRVLAGVVHVPVGGGVPTLQ